MNVAGILQRIEREQAMLASEALRQPQARDAFEYGRVSGLYAGLEMAKRLVLDVEDELERRGFDL